MTHGLECDMLMANWELEMYSFVSRGIDQIHGRSSPNPESSRTLAVSGYDFFMACELLSRLGQKSSLLQAF